MKCSICGKRRARRGCPALGQQICAVCCATKRTVEIRCPSGCTYLVTARSHPAAVVQRQQEQDMTFLVSVVAGLTDAQRGLWLLLQPTLQRHAAGAVPRTTDRDVAEAAAALAATYETAAHGIIYDHQPTSLPAQRLWQALRGVIDGASEAKSSAAHRDAAAALRALERAASTASRAFEADDRAYLQFIDRLVRTVPPGAPEPSPVETPGRLIIP